MKFSEKRIISCGSKELDLHVPVVMGILNLTPDSFYQGSRIGTTDELIDNAGRMLMQGALILDTGAVSTRPGAVQLQSDEECSRLIKPLTALRNAFPEAILSVDTWRKSVAEEAIKAGADIINDISGGNLDQEMIPFMITQKAAYILMHMQGTPDTMQIDPVYDDVVKEVEEFFITRTAVFKKASKHNIILDPGFGFGKTAEHNFQLLNAIPRLSELNYPILAGVSRKSMINKVLHTKPASALNGTTVINTIALLNGAGILRVHDVKEAIEAVKLITFYRNVNMLP